MSPIFFFTDTATTEIYTLSLHDALPISAIVEQPPPVPTHRSHRYEKLVGLPVQLPGLTVSVAPSCVVPEIVGVEVFFGAVPVGCTTSVGRETATPEPLLFAAVT